MPSHCFSSSAMLALVKFSTLKPTFAVPDSIRPAFKIKSFEKANPVPMLFKLSGRE